MKSGAKLWVKRLSGLSVILILVFIGTYGESTDKIIQIMNVEENNLLELESGEEGAIQEIARAIRHETKAKNAPLTPLQWCASMEM